MFKKPKRGLFITGTDTEVGKTYVTSIIARSLIASGYKVGVYKPVASDCIRDNENIYSSDALALWESANRPLTLDDVCPQKFEASIAPHLAAKAAGKNVDSELLRTGIGRWAGKCDVVLVEGAGGLLSPVTDSEYFADLAADFGYRLVVVVPNVLGCINQTLQTLIAAQTFRHPLEVAGIILNDVRTTEGDASVATNLEEIRKRTAIPILGQVTYQGQTTASEVDWYGLTA